MATKHAIYPSPRSFRIRNGLLLTLMIIPMGRQLPKTVTRLSLKILEKNSILKLSEEWIC